MTGANADMHSGVFGGTIFEPMNDLLYLLDHLVGADGRILITDIYDDVDSVTIDESRMYDSIDFDLVCVIDVSLNSLRRHSVAS